MRNLWIFLSRYNAFFFFLIFFTIGIYLTLTRNNYQRSITVNSTNKVVGAAYENLNIWRNYLSLGKVNDSLNEENGRLKAMLLAYQNPDTLKNLIVKDTIFNTQFSCIAARVIKNSITLRNNYITLKKGSNDGVQIGMAVISINNGVVGWVRDVSPDYAIVQSLLHKETKISVLLKKQNALGSLVWGDGNFDFKSAFIKEVPNQFKVAKGDSVITSGSGFFPKGIYVGRVIDASVPTGDNFMSLRIALANDFSTLQYVYIVKDKLAAQQLALEERIPDDQ